MVTAGDGTLRKRGQPHVAGQTSKLEQIHVNAVHNRNVSRLSAIAIHIYGKDAHAESDPKAAR